MKLTKLIGVRLAIALSILIALWGAFFYSSMIDEVNDEIDDMLEEYSEDLMMRFLAGEALPEKSNQTNNQYYITPITPQQAHAEPRITYRDSMIYIRDKHETEPARIITHIFMDEDEQYYRLLVATPTIEKQDLLLNILYWVVVLLAGLTLSILILSLWIYHQTNRPLRKLLRWFQEYRLGETNPPLTNTTKIIEFRLLNEAAIRNAERAERLFAEQRTFTGNVSHELQTPIAIMRHRVEALMERDDLTAGQAEQINLLHEKLEYMTRLNKTLLLLSRIDNGQFAERATIDLVDKIHRALADYREIYADANFSITETLPERAEIHTERTLIGMLLHNLLKNAFVHTPASGAITIRLDGTKLTIANTARDGALDGERIFDRFYQSADRPEGSTGLGLALVRAICTAEGIGVNYTFREGMHTFELSFSKNLRQPSDEK